MTREQAIQVLSMVEAHGSIVIQAKEMAIKALEQQKNGKWMHLSMHDWVFDCSECGFDSDEPYPYCPGCGAKMEESE